MASRHLTLFIIVVSALAAGLGLWLGQREFGAGTAQAPALQATLLYPQRKAVSPFTLQRSDGTPYTLESWKGHWNLLFFGFTHCPDVCPTTLAAFAEVDKALPQGERRPAVRMGFISVDPERDTPRSAGEYAHYFLPGMDAATGELPALEALTRELGVVFMKTALPSGGYTVDHTASVVLVDPQGRVAGLIRPPFDAARIAADLETLSR